MPLDAIVGQRRVDIVEQPVMQVVGVLLILRQSRCVLWQRWWGGRRVQHVVQWWKGETDVYTCRVAAVQSFAIAVQDIGGIV
jgi:hypothetical protein